MDTIKNNSLNKLQNFTENYIILRSHLCIKAGNIIPIQYLIIPAICDIQNYLKYCTYN